MIDAIAAARASFGLVERLWFALTVKHTHASLRLTAATAATISKVLVTLSPSTVSPALVPAPIPSAFCCVATVPLSAVDACALGGLPSRVRHAAPEALCGASVDSFEENLWLWKKACRELNEAGRALVLRAGNGDGGSGGGRRRWLMIREWMKG